MSRAAGEVCVVLILRASSILCSNHTNSLTDALLLVTTVPRNVSRAADVLGEELTRSSRLLETAAAAFDGEGHAVWQRNVHELAD